MLFNPGHMQGQKSPAPKGCTAGWEIPKTRLCVPMSAGLSMRGRSSKPIGTVQCPPKAPRFRSRSG